MKAIFSFIFILFTTLLFSSEELVVEFAPMGGIYEKATNVTLSSINGATIYYTLDGSNPSSGSMRYTKPISVTKVNVIRAIAYHNGKVSPINTQTYFCEREYTLPVISIATNPGNLWDYSTGIYVKGCCADTIEPYLGANYWKSWEKICNIEMYEPDGDLCFNQQAGMSIFGGFSRALPQKSLAIIARKKYGKGKFEYPIFKERHMKKYKSFILRNSGGDFLRTHLRDAYITQLAKPTGVAIQAYQPAIVYINGEYWGIQNIREKINEHYLKDNYGIDKDNVDILRHNGVARHGTSKNYKYLLNYLSTKDMSKDESIEKLGTFMDIHDYIRYNILEVYSGNHDAGGNIRYFRERTDSAKWRWVFYDLDLGLSNNRVNGYKENTLKKFTSINNETWPDPPWSTFIIRKLLENKKIEIQYINTYCDLLNTALHPDTATRLLDNMQNVIRAEMPFHLQKWGSTMKNWIYHVELVRKFVELRPQYMREHLKEKFALGKTIQVKIIVPEGNVAKIKFNSLDIERNFEGIYFEKIPINIKVKPKHDYVFKGWKNRTETDQSLTIKPTTDIVLEPIFEPKPKSIYADSVKINEISYFQIETDSSGDWIELYNRSLSKIDLTGWSITDDNYKNGFFFPSLSIDTNSYVLIVKKKSNFLLYYSHLDSTQIIGDLSFGLSKKGEKVKLYDEKGFLVDSLSYLKLDENLVENFSIALVHPDSLGYKKENWLIENPTPLKINEAYQKYLEEEALKRLWLKRFYVGGGSFFFICLIGILLFRYFKKRKKIN